MFALCLAFSQMIEIANPWSHTLDGTSKPTNGDGQATTAEATPSAEGDKGTEGTNREENSTSSKINQGTEETKPEGNSPSAETAPKPDPAEDDKKPASLGDKREHESTPAPTDNEKPDTAEPTSKKQKTDNKPAEDSAAKAAPAANGNGEKKKGRPKKTPETKETAKRDIPTDGIGSRTRSRTKAT